MNSDSLPLVAIVGCGRIAHVHARNLRPNARLQFASRRRDSARRFAVRYSGEIASGMDEVLGRPDVSGVVIATPPGDHADLAVAALRAGKTVLIEKPMATSAAEVDRIDAALEGRPAGALMVAENYCYKPLFRMLRRWLPALGTIRRVHLKRLTRQQATGWRRDCGALLEGGIHYVALLGTLIDEEPKSVSAQFRLAPSRERRSHVQVRYPSGATGTIRYSWNHRALPGGVLQHSRIVGEKGRIVFESNGLYALFAVSGFRRFEVFARSDFSGFRAMTRDFLRSVRDPTKAPYSNFARARRDLGIVLQAYGAAG